MIPTQRHLVAIVALASGATMHVHGQGARGQSAPVASVRYGITDLGAALRSMDDITPFVDSTGTVVTWRLGSDNRVRTQVQEGKHVVGPTTPLPGFPDTYVADINAAGVMVGMCKKPTGTRYARAFVFRKQKLCDLGTLGGDYSRAYSVRSQVAGAADTADQHIHAFVCDTRPGAALLDLGTLPGGDYSSARGINRRGQVVGVANVVPNGVNHAFLWEHGHMRDLGLLTSGSYAHAQAINDSGQVVCWANSRGETHAVLWRRGEAHDIAVEGSDTSSAWGINNRGQIVGTSESGRPHKTMHAYLWEHGKPMDLNDLIPAQPDRQLNFAYRVNDRGQIVCVGTLRGAIRAYLLTPLEGPR